MNFKKGFTAGEIVIVTVIIALLTLISVNTYIKERDRIVYNNSLIRILNIIKTARNNAITSYRIKDNNGNMIVPRDGYGVYINLLPRDNQPAYVKLFAGIHPAGADLLALNKTFDPARDIVLETYEIPKQTVLQSFYFKNSTGNYEEKINLMPADGVNFTYTRTKTEWVILFRPPLAETYLGDNQTGDGAESSLEEAVLKIVNRSAPADSPKKCEYIILNRIKTFAELISETGMAGVPNKFSESEPTHCNFYDKQIGK